MNRILFVLPIFLAIAIGALRNTSAEEFRIESKVFADTTPTPVSESVTLFADSRVYVFMNSPREITLLDIPRNRIVLIDPRAKSAPNSPPKSWPPSSNNCASALRSKPIP